jgi:hypothetical protein
MKHEWRKKEKSLYLPKSKPEIIEIPEMKYFTIRGEGNPNSENFAAYIEILYSASYAIRMSHKKNMQPEGFYEYTVYPLEGFWDVNEKAKQTKGYQLDKNDLVFHLMIRQPDFVNSDYAEKMLTMVKSKSVSPLIDKVRFESISEGKCIQMLHIGSYDNEPESFLIMEKFAEENGLKRISKVHKEIYLTDARKVEPENLKTVLRFQVEG